MGEDCSKTGKSVLLLVQRLSGGGLDRDSPTLWTHAGVRPVGGWFDPLVETEWSPPSLGRFSVPDARTGGTWHAFLCQVHV